MSLIERIDEVLHQQGRSRRWLAEIVGVSIGAFGTWKTRGNFPTADVIVRIGDALGVSAEYLVTGSDRQAGPYETAIRERPMLRQLVNRLLKLQDSDAAKLFPILDALFPEADSSPID